MRDPLLAVIFPESAWTFTLTCLIHSLAEEIVELEPWQERYEERCNEVRDACKLVHMLAYAVLELGDGGKDDPDLHHRLREMVEALYDKVGYDGRKVAKYTNKLILRMPRT